ncbi:polysaccharide deacetylase family protein [Hymenobacter radiodurans]|uniref:polysaccharide deacetylase family protein n=1 Tax=Hymenobacter radiodurans TaxID=2496028 RepID=UPI001058A431|nr:polysaccharide deacetylase family protein [Hymenobacter radiodurans]
MLPTSHPHGLRDYACQVLLLVALCLVAISAGAQQLRRAVPDKVVVLTFDDAALTHATYVAPLLKKYGFGATFYVCEFRPDFADKTKYMSWAQIADLHRQGFEIGSHTLTHKHVNKMSAPELVAELDSIESRCAANGISKPTTFAYPAYDTHPIAFTVLPQQGYQFARVGGDKPYDPATHNPLLIPSFTTTGTDKQHVLTAIQQAVGGKIVVLTVHGVPDYAHDWVTTPPALFEEYLRYLHNNNYRVIALRDLKKYVRVPTATAAKAPKS